MNNTYPFSQVLQVRYSDTDAQGHLYFANYLVFADEVAGNFMEEMGYPISQPDKAPTLTFTVNINCDYLGECKYGDQIGVQVGYQRLGNSSALVGFEMCNDTTGEALARGSFTQVFVDHDTRKSCAMPDSLRQQILQRQPELA